MNTGKRTRKPRRILFILMMLILDVAVIWILGEIVLRLIPIPGIYYNVYRYDPQVGGGLYPHTTEIYRDYQGNFIKRKVNRWGYLDKDHSPQKPAGIYRIGFFGDSFSQARHVPLEQTFFRIIENQLDSVETIAIGIRGYSMLQSYLNYRRWSPFFDMDMIVYVFVENDLGDQLPEVDHSGDKPYPVLTADGFKIDYSFRERNRHKTRGIYPIVDFLSARSLFFATVSERLKLLIHYGIKIRLNEDERIMATGKDKTCERSSTDLPSTWPQDLKTKALQTGAAVLSRWRAEVAAQKKAFVVLYVPREVEFKKPTRQQDSWKLWLENFCKKKGIVFIDPSDKMIATEKAGQRVFYDHFTKTGHQAFAQAFIEWFKLHAKEN